MTAWVQSPKTRRGLEILTPNPALLCVASSPSPCPRNPKWSESAQKPRRKTVRRRPFVLSFAREKLFGTTGPATAFPVPPATVGRIRLKPRPNRRIGSTPKQNALFSSTADRVFRSVLPRVRNRLRLDVVSHRSDWLANRNIIYLGRSPTTRYDSTREIF